MASLHVEIVAPERAVWSGEAEIVIARTTDGEIGVLAHHTPLLGVLVPGPLIVRREGEPDLVAAVHGGFLSVTDDGVVVLADGIELADEIDAGRARRALERARSANAEDAQARAAAARASARLRVAGDTV